MKSLQEWPEVGFGEVFDISSSKRVLESQWKKSGIPFYRAREIVKLSESGRVENELFIDEELYDDYEKKYGVPQVGDLMVSAVGTLGACYVVGSRDKFYFKDASVLQFRPRARIDSRFFWHAFKTQELIDQINAWSGSTVGTLTISRAKELKIKLPPLEEQKRIAAILDQVDELRRKRQRALDRLNQLGQAIFIEMFGDPITNPMGWRVTHLGEIVRDGDKINYGVVQPGDEVEGGVPLVRVGDLLKPFIDRSLIKQIDPAIESKYARSRLAGDEILIGCVGSIGAVALAHPGLEGANIARAVARVPADDSKVDRRFLAEMIRSPLVQRYFTAETRTVAQPTLNIGLIVQAPILLPPLEFQRQFSHTLDTIEPVAKALVSGAVASDRLFTSLQHRAFSGELTASSLTEAAA